jgi:cell wall-associated NlpC family hydrolase
VFVWSGISTAEADSDTVELTGAPVSTDPSEEKPEANVVPELKENFPEYSQVVDNANKNRFKAYKQWETRSGKPRSYGKTYRTVKPSKEKRLARYKVKIPATDVYSVYAWWPKELGKKASARIGVETDSGTTVDQSRDGGYWVPIGEYKMEKGDSYSIKIMASSKAKDPVVADAMAVVRGVVAFPPDPPEEKVGGVKGSNESADKGSDEITYSGAARATRPVPPRRVMVRARMHIGTSYGNRRCKAFVQEDCSCFTKLVYKKWRKLPDSPLWQWYKGQRIKRSNIRRGDLVFFDTSGDGRLGHWDHVGVYAGNGYLIHANNYYKYMKVHKQKMKYVPGYWGAKRLRYR